MITIPQAPFVVDSEYQNNSVLATIAIFRDQDGDATADYTTSYLVLETTQHRSRSEENEQDMPNYPLQHASTVFVFMAPDDSHSTTPAWELAETYEKTEFTYQKGLVTLPARDSGSQTTAKEVLLLPPKSGLAKIFFENETNPKHIQIVIVDDAGKIVFEKSLMTLLRPEYMRTGYIHPRPMGSNKLFATD